MGCDIHPCIQVRTPQGWESAGYGPMETEDRGDYEPWPVLKQRNYHLFSILAGVRGGADSIADPRGLPKPLGTVPESRYTKGEPMDFGDHSFSWVTLAELEQYPWNGPTNVHGEMISHAEACSDFHDLVLPWLRKLCADRDVCPEDVRLVFGFDS